MTEIPPTSRRLILASSSPRRVELLHHAGLSFDISQPEVEEAHDSNLTPDELTIENAKRKALAIAQQHADALVLGADTLVYVDGEPLGKPHDHAEAMEMLMRLSGRAHEVCTGVYLAWNSGRSGRGFHVITQVFFKPLNTAQIKDYHHKVNPLDKAGAYGIQEHGDMIIAKHEGSWTNVMGLPLERLREEWDRLTAEFSA